MQAETPQTDAAIAATSGLVLSYGGALATSYFSSSSGGETANVQEVFPGAKPTPYLVAVPDPYDTASPYHDWTASFTGTQIATALGYAGTITGLSIQAYPSGRVQTLTVQGSTGSQAFPAGTVRTALSLRSTWFTTGTATTVTPAPVTTPAPVAKAVSLTLAKPRITGKQVVLHGTAPAGPLVLQGAAGATWRTLATVTPSPTGAISLTRPLGETPLYRLQQGLTATPAVRVSVATGLTIRKTATGFATRIYPALRRTLVLQRATPDGWTWMARATTNAAGKVALTRRGLPAGTYRARFGGDSIYRVSASRPVHRGAPAVRTLAWTPSDPMYASQWNDRAVRAFDYWPQLPTFDGSPVIVAVIDGGIDDDSPDLLRPDMTSVVARTFTVVSGSPSLVHGTAVAGIIAARANNGIGIAGLDQSVSLFDVRVVGADGTIDPKDEARGIRLAVDNGARVINLSLGGLRAPGRSDDEYSRVEQDAIDYAYSKGAVIVAAVGNSDRPYPFASYPAALPHVLGVSAVGPDLRTPRFSNRDAVYNDLAAPGVGILTTVPRDTTPSGLSQNAPLGDVVGPGGTVEGTSFAAPHVSAAAAPPVRAGPAPHERPGDGVARALCPRHHAGERQPGDARRPRSADRLRPARHRRRADGRGHAARRRLPRRAQRPAVRRDAAARPGRHADGDGELLRRSRGRLRRQRAPGRPHLGADRAVHEPLRDRELDGVAWLPGTMNVSRFTSAKIAATTLGTGPISRMSFITKRSGVWPIEVIARSG